MYAKGCLELCGQGIDSQPWAVVNQCSLRGWLGACASSNNRAAFARAELPLEATLRGLRSSWGHNFELLETSICLSNIYATKPGIRTLSLKPSWEEGSGSPASHKKAFCQCSPTLDFESFLIFIILAEKNIFVSLHISQNPSVLCNSSLVGLSMMF